MIRPFAFCLFLFAFAVQGVLAQNEDSAEIAIAAAFDASGNAWNDADINGHVAMYADSAAFMMADGPAFGRERTAEILENAYFQDGAPAQELSFSRLTVTMLGDDHAMATGRYLLSGGGLDNKMGWFTTIWEHNENGWQIIHDHSS